MKTIRQTATFKAAPEVVYEMLMDSRRHAKFTGDKARISREVGGKIMAYDGYIDGLNLEIVPNRKIVQSWRGSDWPEGHYSKATFALAKVKGGTRLTFTQSGIPEDQVEPIKEGWKEHYWDKMKALLAAEA
jgi:activator of HSP90 ATPase